ncbi:phospholipid scramblase 1 [Mortierella sp. GBA30]|nr:phospholipid scramblase 1 [Mortierella sp. GBA30]
MASSFSQKEIDDFKESFNAFDVNGDGAINSSELRSLLRVIGEKFNAAAIKDSMQQFDLNNDEHIDFDEFLNLVDKLTKNKTP